jgi:hypothetical protein
VEVRDSSVTIILPCHVISTVFVGIGLSITWPNRFLAILGVINEGVLGSIPPSQQIRSATRAGVIEKSDIPPKAKVKAPHERY